jgi:asparagine synthase (glutamine-hydrolysing)
MCGIAGVAGTEPVSPDGLAAMCRTVVHRGPDDEGIATWPDHGVGLGHRRLSIIDLSSAGREPMGNEDGTVWVVCNGEIYNYRHLRRELERAGHRFRSHTDVEVVVHAYEEWGDAHVTRLRGMFAYALYDRRPGADDARGYRLLLVRDRIGIKPLFYAWSRGRLVFGSEIKTVLAWPGVDRSIDREAVFDYLTYGYVPAPKTAYAAIRKLEPGHLLALDGQDPTIRPYWDAPVGRSSRISVADAADAAEAVLGTLEEAVGLHTESDVPIGVFLSGGIDSSSVMALLAEHAEGPVLTFSMGFDVAEHGETGFARMAAERHGTDHREGCVGAGDVPATLDRLASAFDEPFGDGSAIPTYRLSGLARERVKVVLSGDGGDEVFGGYRWYRRHLGSRRAGMLPPFSRRAIFGTLARIPGVPHRAGLARTALDEAGQYASLLEVFSPGDKRRILAPAWAREFRGYDDHWHVRRFWNPDLDPYLRMQYVDLKTYLPDDILVKVDRASMAWGLEVRPPMLDHVVVEQVLALPLSVRIPGGEPKGLLKRAVAGLVPQEVLDRPKKGFSVPWPAWLDSIRPWAMADLRAGTAVRAGILGPLWERSLDAPNRGARLWSLLMLERWASALELAGG